MSLRITLAKRNIKEKKKETEGIDSVYSTIRVLSTKKTPAKVSCS